MSEIASSIVLSSPPDCQTAFPRQHFVRRGGQTEDLTGIAAEFGITTRTVSPCLITAARVLGQRDRARLVFILRANAIGSSFKAPMAKAAPFSSNFSSTVRQPSSQTSKAASTRAKPRWRNCASSTRRPAVITRR
jgi:hypothetical protein